MYSAYVAYFERLITIRDKQRQKGANICSMLSKKFAVTYKDLDFNGQKFWHKKISF